ncbi:hypothetical protein VZT92_026313 [Zoarces viviparus]|uniref:Uncharacterized protein n=1 Tax=Zoarces viviparus TaxID=48416 RepID=A0AAW1DZE9_ZOAVI
MATVKVRAAASASFLLHWTRFKELKVLEKEKQDHVYFEVVRQAKRLHQQQTVWEVEEEPAASRGEEETPAP